MPQISYISVVVLVQLTVLLIIRVESSSNKAVSFPNGCAKFNNDLPSIKKTYVLREYDYNANLLTPIISVPNNILDDCNQTKNELTYPGFEFNLRIQYHHTYSCIRIELDLGANFSRLTNDLGFNYYMFSYRELTMPFYFLNQNPLNESVNTLIINKLSLTPYIICLTFLRQKIDNSLKFYEEFKKSNKTCGDYSEFLFNNQRRQETELCIDINLNKFEPELINGKSNIFAGNKSSELIMVLFIIFLLIIMLASITFAHFLIERPKKRLMLSALRNYIRDKKETQNEILKSRSNDSLHPSIVVTDCSDQSKNCESETLIGPKNLKTIGTNNPVVRFSIDEETFCEMNPKNNNLDDLDEEEALEALKSISHLLNDKPWQSTSQQIYNRITRTNSFAE